MKTAIITDWLTVYAGAERVVEQIIACFPDADIFTLVDGLPATERGFLRGRPVTTSFIQKLPFAKTKYRSYLPLMPLAIEQFDLSAYDLVISSSHAVAKGVITGPSQTHICYCHSPIRYAWDLQNQYLREARLERGLKSWIARWILHKIRLWDTRASLNVDYFIANSRFVARRIRKAYRRDATVIYPPIDLDNFSFRADKQDFYLTVSRLVPYKKINMIVEAFASMPDKKLVVIGDGPDYDKIKALARRNVTMLGFQPNEVLRDYMRHARAFLFAAEEDFGIVPLEAQACGTPVIAFGRGGALETVRGVDQPRPTGVFFNEQTAVSLIAAIDQFERDGTGIKPEDCRANAERFSVQAFRDKFSDFVARASNAHSAADTLQDVLDDLNDEPAPHRAAG